MPLFNSLLRLNRFGRMVLSRKEVWQSNVVLLLLIPAIVAGVVYLLSSEITTGVYAEEIGLGCGFTAIFASTAFICSAGWPRTAMTVGTILYIAGVTVSLWLLYQAFNTPQFDPAARIAIDRLVDWHNKMLFATLILLFGGNFLAAARPKR